MDEYLQQPPYGDDSKQAMSEGQPISIPNSGPHAPASPYPTVVATAAPFSPLHQQPIFNNAQLQNLHNQQSPNELHPAAIFQHPVDGDAAGDYAVGSHAGFHNHHYDPLAQAPRGNHVLPPLDMGFQHTDPTVGYSVDYSFQQEAGFQGVQPSQEANDFMDPQTPSIKLQRHATENSNVSVTQRTSDLCLASEYLGTPVTSSGTSSPGGQSLGTFSPTTSSLGYYSPIAPVEMSFTGPSPRRPSVHHNHYRIGSQGSKRSAQSQASNQDLRQGDRVADESNIENDNDAVAAGPSVDGRPAKKARTDVNRYACPYFQHDVTNISPGGACSGPGFDDFGRVKEHLDRAHSTFEKLLCDRCKSTWAKKNEKLFEAHRLKNACTFKPFPKYFMLEETYELIKNINGRKMTHDQKWERAFELLFPRAPVPWHYNDTSSFDHDRQKVTRQFEEKLPQLLAGLSRQVNQDSIGLLMRALDRVFVDVGESQGLPMRKSRYERVTPSLPCQPPQAVAVRHRYEASPVAGTNNLLVDPELELAPAEGFENLDLFPTYENPHFGQQNQQ